MPKKFNHPAWLTGTPEEQKAEAERQALALASHGRGHLSEAERLIGRGKLLEETAKGNLEQADSDETRTLAENQLADAMAMSGQYADAAAIHNDPARREYFEEIVKALEMPDDEKCNCADSTAKIDNVDIAITPRFEKARIFSPLHNDLVSLVVCQFCGHANARELKSRLLKHNDARAHNESAVKGRGMISDAEVLRVEPA